MLIWERSDWTYFSRCLKSRGRLKRRGCAIGLEMCRFFIFRYGLQHLLVRQYRSTDKSRDRPRRYQPDAYASLFAN